MGPWCKTIFLMCRTCIPTKSPSGTSHVVHCELVALINYSKFVLPQLVDVRLNAVGPLSRTAPSTPLPSDIDVELGSTSESWLLISQSHEDPRVHPSSATVACQTSTLLHSQEVPRSNLKKTLPLQATNLQTKIQTSKITLHYGGLEAPELHCFSSSLTTHCDTQPQSIDYFTRPTAKSLPSPATFRKAATSLQSTAQKDESDADRARTLLRDIFYEIGFSSKLFCDIYNSAFIDQHINRIADRLGAGGLLMYIQVWNHWAWCQCHSSLPAEAPLWLVLDYLHASDHLKR